MTQERTLGPPLQDKHWLEQRADWFVELSEHMITEYMRLLSTQEGRPAFMEPVSPAEQMETFMNPEKRMLMEGRVKAAGGEEAVQRYRRAMIELIDA